jgi:tetratricopeptide (TPR) repeat protein
MSFNTSRTLGYALSGDFDIVIDILGKGTKSKEFCMLMDAYYFTGQFGKSNEMAKILISGYDGQDYYDYAQNYIKVFQDCDYDDFPRPTRSDYIQSIERPNETYEDLDEIHMFSQANDEEFNKLVKNLDYRTANGTYEERAKALFIKGEMFLLLKNYEACIYYYRKAIELNPNKALYWGYMGQVMNRYNFSPFLSGRYIEEAIKLDKDNPRWRFLRGVILLKLAEYDPRFSKAVLKENEKALQLCRNEQIGLKKAVENQLGLVNTLDNEVKSTEIVKNIIRIEEKPDGLEKIYEYQVLIEKAVDVLLKNQGKFVYQLNELEDYLHTISSLLFNYSVVLMYYARDNFNLIPNDQIVVPESAILMSAQVKPLNKVNEEFLKEADMAFADALELSRLKSGRIFSTTVRPSTIYNYPEDSAEKAKIFLECYRDGYLDINSYR